MFSSGISSKQSKSFFKSSKRSSTKQTDFGTLRNSDIYNNIGRSEVCMTSELDSSIGTFVSASGNET